MGSERSRRAKEVLSAVDIVELVSRDVRLHRVGTIFKGLCPFHEEKTPSFHVRRDTGLYHCFGCGRGGNAIGWIMEWRQIPAFEAIAALAEMYGIQLA